MHECHRAASCPMEPSEKVQLDWVVQSKKYEPHNKGQICRQKSLASLANWASLLAAVKCLCGGALL